MHFTQTVEPEQYRRPLTAKDQAALERVLHKPVDYGSKVLLFNRISRVPLDFGLSLTETADFFLRVGPYGSDASGRLFAAPLGPYSTPATRRARCQGQLRRANVMQARDRIMLGASHSFFAKEAKRRNAAIPAKSKRLRATVAQVVEEVLPRENFDDDKWRDVFRCIPEGVELSIMEWAVYWLLFYESSIHGDLRADRARGILDETRRQWKSRNSSVGVKDVDEALESLETKGLLRKTRYGGADHLAVLNAAGKRQIEYLKRVNPASVPHAVHIDGTYDARHGIAVHYSTLHKMHNTAQMDRAKTLVPGYAESGKLVTGLDLDTNRLILKTEEEIDEIYEGMADNQTRIGGSSPGGEVPTLEEAAREVCRNFVHGDSPAELPAHGSKALALAVLCKQAGVPVPRHVADNLIRMASYDAAEAYVICGPCDAALAYLLEKHKLLEEVACYQPEDQVPLELADLCVRMTSGGKRWVDRRTGDIYERDARFA